MSEYAGSSVRESLRLASFASSPRLSTHRIRSKPCPQRRKCVFGRPPERSISPLFVFPRLTGGLSMRLKVALFGSGVAVAGALLMGRAFAQDNPVRLLPPVPVTEPTLLRRCWSRRRARTRRLRRCPPARSRGNRKRRPCRPLRRRRPNRFPPRPRNPLRSFRSRAAASSPARRSRVTRPTRPPRAPRSTPPSSIIPAL